MTLSSRDPHLGQRIVLRANYHTIRCGVNPSLGPFCVAIECGQRIDVTTCRHLPHSEMQNHNARSAAYGAWLVALGAALWGTESAWRIPLNAVFDAKVIVFWEHVLLLIMFLPILISRLHEIPKVNAYTWGFVLFSGFAGSA